MNRLITGIVVFVLLLSLGGWSLWKTTHSCEQLGETAGKALELIHQNDVPAAREQIHQLAEDWDSEEPILELLVRHNSLDEVEVQINLLEEWIEIDHTQEAAAALSAIIGILQHIQESEPPLLRNIF